MKRVKDTVALSAGCGQLVTTVSRGRKDAICVLTVTKRSRGSVLNICRYMTSEIHIILILIYCNLLHHSRQDVLACTGATRCLMFISISANTSESDTYLCICYELEACIFVERIPSVWLYLDRGLGNIRHTKNRSTTHT